MSVLLSTISGVVTQRVMISEADLRIGTLQRDREARAAVLWLAEQLSEVTMATAGLWVGVDLAEANRLAAELKARIETDGWLGAQLQEWAVECLATQGVNDRLNLKRAERDPAAVARSLIQVRGVASSVEIRSLAAAFLALDEPAIMTPEPGVKAATQKATGAVLNDATLAAAALQAAISHRAFTQARHTSEERLAATRRERAFDALCELMAVRMPPLKAKPKIDNSETAALAAGV